MLSDDARATHDSIHGADQKSAEFMHALITNLRHEAPAGPHPGQYENRGDDPIYAFIRDHLKPEMNKFNIALRAVVATQPTGVSEEEKINMAIAIHLQKTTRMEYKYRNQNPHEWRYYEAWKVLRNTSKFRMPQAGAVRGRDFDWNVVNDENEPGNEKVAHADNQQDESSNENLPENEAFHLKRASRGKAKGQKAAKKAKIVKESSRRKEDELKKLNKISERRLVTQQQSNQIMGIRTLLQYSTDENE
jgi:hypothetical protein